MLLIGSLKDTALNKYVFVTTASFPCPEHGYVLLIQMLRNNEHEMEEIKGCFLSLDTVQLSPPPPVWFHMNPHWLQLRSHQNLLTWALAKAEKLLHWPQKAKQIMLWDMNCCLLRNMFSLSSNVPLQLYWCKQNEQINSITILIDANGHCFFAGKASVTLAQLLNINLWE